MLSLRQCLALAQELLPAPPTHGNASASTCFLLRQHLIMEGSAVFSGVRRMQRKQQQQQCVKRDDASISMQEPGKRRPGRPRGSKKLLHQSSFQTPQTNNTNIAERQPEAEASTSSKSRTAKKSKGVAASEKSNERRERAKRVSKTQNGDSVFSCSKESLEVVDLMAEKIPLSEEKTSSRQQASVAVKDSHPESSIRENDELDYPLWVEEDDPTWPEEADEGWGFRLSDYFKDPKIVKSKIGSGEDDSDGNDSEDYDWDGQPDRWTAKEISSLEWEPTVFEDPSPLLVLMFQRYGKRTKECFQLLTEVENAVNRIWDSNKLPPRMIKIDGSLEVDLASALHVKEYPVLLFIKAGKLLHRLRGSRTSEELLKIISHFFYGAGRPSCLDDIQSPVAVSKSVSLD